MPIKKIKIGEYLAKLLAKQEGGCLLHFLRLLAVWWPGAQKFTDSAISNKRPLIDY